MPEYTELSRAERRDLYRAARRCPGAVAERIHYVRLAAQGRSDVEIARIFEVDARTVRASTSKIQAISASERPWAARRT